MANWSTQTQDANNMVLKDEDENVLGIVRYMPKTRKYMASTAREYLGMWFTLNDAQTQVEKKLNIEVKRVIIGGKST